MIKCAFVIPSLNIGGAEKQLLSYVRQRPSQVEAHVFYMGAEPRGLVDEFKQTGACMHFVAREDKSLIPFLILLYKAIAETKPDTLCTFMHGTAGTFGRACAFLTGVKHIYHSDRFLDPEVTKFHRAVRPIVDRVTEKFFPNAYSTAEWLITLGVPSQKIRVLPNAVDTGYFTPTYQGQYRQHLGLPSQAVIGGFLGRFRPEKNVEGLLAALKSMKVESRPDYFLLGGDGPLWERARQFAESDRWLHEHCRFVGLVRDPREFLSALDFLVLPSNGEGTPNVVLEAMALGKPIVATHICDLPQIVEGIGFLAEPSDVPSLTQALTQMMLLDEPQRQRLGANARQKVEQGWALQVSSQKFWDEILCGNN